MTIIGVLTISANHVRQIYLKYWVVTLSVKYNFQNMNFFYWILINIVTTHGECPSWIDYCVLNHIVYAIVEVVFPLHKNSHKFLLETLHVKHKLGKTIMFWPNLVGTCIAGEVTLITNPQRSIIGVFKIH